MRHLYSVEFVRWTTLFALLTVWGVDASPAQNAEVRDLDFEQEGTEIVITYDLIANQGEEYEATLLFSSSGGEVFDYEPEAVTGDVGGDIEPGLDKEIRWSVLQDFPSGLQSPSVQFKIVLEEEGGGSGWVLASLIAGGGGTVAGIATGVLPCFSFIPGSISNKLCPAAGDDGGGPPGDGDNPDPIADPTGPPN